jgi:hypothetical protein
LPLRAPSVAVAAAAGAVSAAVLVSAVLTMRVPFES